MKFELANELEVPASANDVWAIYSSPDFPKLLKKLVPDILESVEYVEGDGHLGTVIHLVYVPGTYLQLS